MVVEKILHIEVVYALSHEQQIFKVIATSDSTVKDIIESSGVLEAYPDISLEQNKVGIFSRQVKLDAKVQDGDRIEIYRPLLADPKEVRRRRAAQGNKN